MSLVNDLDKSVYSEKNGVKHFFQPGDIVLPCSSIETFLARGGMYGVLNTVQVIWLKSKKPIDPEDVRQSLLIATRQVPHLQFCLLKEGSKFWFKRMMKLEIDFEVSDKEVLPALNEMCKTTYNLWDGPLWKVRLIDTGENMDASSVALIFAFQHSIVDGSTIMGICREVVANLNRIMAAEPLVLNYSPILDVTEGAAQAKYSFFSHYWKIISKFYSTMILDFSRVSSFNGALELPRNPTSDTKTFFGEFSKMETEKIISLCKKEAITVHTLVVTMANFALLTVAESRSTTKIGSTTLSVTYCVNMRRYYDPRFVNANGCHVSYLEDKIQMSLSDAKDIWTFARKIQADSKDKIEIQKEPLKLFPLLHMAWIIAPVNQYLSRNGYRNKSDCHYVTTSMGNLKSFLPDPAEGDNVEITNILRSGNIENAGSPFVLAFQTFRGKFLLSMDYSTNKMTDEVAEEIYNVLIRNIRDCINDNCININL